MTRSFDAYAALAAALLEQRAAIVERLESLALNVKGKALAGERDPRRIAAVIDTCAFGAPGVPRDAAAVRDELRAARLADGFEPLFARAHADPLDPANLVLRAYQSWNAQRWPGANGRLAYAQALYGAFILRLLEPMALRVWDDPYGEERTRLHTLQSLLDRLNGAASGTAMVRDARWLIQTAQGAITRHLAPYFRVAARVADSFDGADGDAVHAAGVMLAGGHLRSQWRQRARELQRDADDPEVLATTRNSNALDVALLVWDLVPLLDSYAAAVSSGDRYTRRRLAAAIFQGWSADPELLLTRLDLLEPSTMIETLFVEADGRGGHRYSEIGLRHRHMLSRYRERIGHTAQAMTDDAAASAPSAGAYSPLGLEYGFCADLLARIAVDSCHRHAARPMALEDFFAPQDAVPPAAGDGISYWSEWADTVFARTNAALARRAASPDRVNASERPNASVIVRPDVPAGGTASAQEHCVTSDVGEAVATGASAFPRTQFLADRHEARFLASAETNGRWFGLSKVVLTLRLAQGEDAVVGALPDEVGAVLRLTCPQLVTWRDGKE